MNNLMMEPCFREKSKWTSSRKEAVLRAKKYLHEELVDQIPVLADLRRALEELAVFQAPPATSVPAPLVIEHVATIHEAIVKAATTPEGAWAALIERQKACMCPQGTPVLGAAAPTVASPVSPDPVMAEVAEALSSKATEDLVARPTCPVCGRAATKRCSRCKSEWYDSKECQVRDWARHKQTCEQVVEKLSKLS
jgi:hypothetical protein